MSEVLDKLTIIEKPVKKGVTREKTTKSAQVTQLSPDSTTLKIPETSVPDWVAAGDEVVGSRDGDVKVSGRIAKLRTVKPYVKLTVKEE